jgi:hypothetical protein
MRVEFVSDRIPPVVFIFLVSLKSDLIKIYLSLEDYQGTKFHGPTLSVASFASNKTTLSSTTTVSLL